MNFDETPPEDALNSTSIVPVDDVGKVADALATLQSRLAVDISCVIEYQGDRARLLVALWPCTHEPAEQPPAKQGGKPDPLAPEDYIGT